MLFVGREGKTSENDMPYYRLYGGVPKEITTWENFAGKDYITVTEIAPSERATLGAPGEIESYALCDGEPLAWNPATSAWENFFTVLGIPMNTGPQGDKGDKGDKGDAGADGTNGTNGTVTGYQNTTLKTALISACKSASVSSGFAVFQLTTDGLSTGDPIFPNEVFDESIQFVVNDATAAYQFGWTLTNSNKTLTAIVNVLNISALEIAEAPNGTIVNLTIKGR